MHITSRINYNQGIGKFKLLSSTAGVGAIITTKIGYSVLVSDINQWRFIQSTTHLITRIRELHEHERHRWYELTKAQLKDIGVAAVDDARFLEFLRDEKELPELLCLIEIPSLSLNEQFNNVNVSNNPVIARIRRHDAGFGVDDLTIHGTHFPRWFINRKKQLKTYSQWKDLWIRSGQSVNHFAPPRDCDDPVCDANGKQKQVKVRDRDGVEYMQSLFHQLTQLNLILICPNGHLSDIPWSRFLRWKLERKPGKGSEKDIGEKENKKDNGERLFSEVDPCCDKPDLKWTENKNKSEGYGSIYLECNNCGKGQDDRKVTLKGINNLRPYCMGHKPWEGLMPENGTGPQDQHCRAAGRPHGERMQVALVTGNNVYFATVFSSLFVPEELVSGMSEDLKRVLNECNEKFEKLRQVVPDRTKAEWADKYIDSDLLHERGLSAILVQEPGFIEKLKSLFLKEGGKDRGDDPHEHYRWEEYQCFKSNPERRNKAGLSFKDIDLPRYLSGFFNKIQQVDELQITQIQLNFTRVQPGERVRNAEGQVIQPEGQNIFSINRENVYVMPANKTYGEGIFFEFSDAAISAWTYKHQAEFSGRLALLNGAGSTGSWLATWLKIQQYGSKQFLIHTFSHLLMKELEFTCGYPTASLKERLYISERMSGVLIYTAEGSEGSMGGLVWQAQPENIMKLIKGCLIRALDCSADPLCWESDGQGLYNLNLASCFSCSLVSETACEEMNLGLDRRILIDPVFGFFRSLL